jgi:hypothetical protein
MDLFKTSYEICETETYLHRSGPPSTGTVVIGKIFLVEEINETSIYVKN